MAQETLRFGIVGVGGMGRAHAREIAVRSDAHIVAACDASAAALDRFFETIPMLDRASVAEFASLEQMLTQAQLDAIVVATPHTQHSAQIKRCLEAGLHVLCEKPLATTAADARTSAELARQHGRTLAIAYQRHGSPLYRRAHDVVVNGEIGEIVLVTVLIAQDCLENFIDPSKTWRADPALSGGGHLMDTGSHIVDMLLYISGLEPEEVYASIDNHGALVDVVSALTLRFRNGARGTLAATSLSMEPWREEFSFYGTKGVLNIRDGRITLHKKGEDTRILRGSGQERRPVADFIEAIRGAVPAPQAPAVYGLRVAQITEAAYRSAQSGAAERAG
ncbi:MAG: Gfo/Idh/MocA family oxidoreductase [Chloroflexi bacterium]|nr:Gfo/Idh/MocA family oxidoreductase [Chloroflexota bacterium]